MTTRRLPKALLGTTAALTLLAAAPLRAQALKFAEDFDDVAGLAAKGWAFANRSDSPGLPWIQGNPNDRFDAHAGPPDSYAATGQRATNAEIGTVSNWLLTPTLSLQNGDEITFFTRTTGNSLLADRLELRLSTNGASVNVGPNHASVGDFVTVLFAVNPSQMIGDYPATWTPFTVTILGLEGPVEGRLGFRYFVTDSGVNGVHGDYIGLDTLRVTSTAVPEPSTYALGIAALLGVTIALRRRTKAEARS